MGQGSYCGVCLIHDSIVDNSIIYYMGRPLMGRTEGTALKDRPSQSKSDVRGGRLLDSKEVSSK